MCTLKFKRMWVVAFFVALVAVGCGREQAGSRTRPIVTSTFPANAATVVPANTTITATFSETMAASTINASSFTVTGPGGTSVPGTVTAAGSTATFTPASFLLPNSTYTATINNTVADPNGLTLASNVSWTFTTGTVPQVTSFTPAAGALLVPTNQRVTATFSEAMSATTVTAPGTFTVAVAGAGGANVNGIVTYVPATNTAIFTPTQILAPSTGYTAKITTAAQSVSGVPLTSNVMWNFTTGLVPSAIAPIVISTVPAAGATNVPLNSKVSAVFSSVMDPAAITAPGTFTLAVSGLGGAPVPGTVTYAGTTATFSPNANLAASTQYTGTITTAAKDLTGNALAANYLFSFTTGLTADTTAPTITLTTPLDADINVPLNKAISATFSEAMDPTTITAPGTFTLAVFGPGGAAVPGTVTYDLVSHIATFTPTANLIASTHYTATILTAAKDLAGNALAAGASANPWSFTTGASVATLTAPNLGTAATFGIFGSGAGITNQGVNTVINGNIGTTGADTLVTGFHDTAGCVYTETPLNIGLVNGTIDTAPGTTLACGKEADAGTTAVAAQAAADTLTAYNTLAAIPGGTDPGAGQLGGLVLAPGVYKAAGGTFLLTGSDLTLDAQGDTSAVWVFQTAAALTVGAPGAPRSIILVNGAQAKNVFWQVGSAATINGAGGGTFAGTIISSAGVTFSTAGNAAITTLNGRALALIGPVTVVNTVITLP